ncbi:hypothetical protein [Maribacter sp. 4G9]|uniref:hypothetical protein n=1 Tax=Maribacter sp. 4G9 TaxID=1889777 RepID=UPI000C161CD6|nr:hypothetical protein [Maribacter sp. 4G9]PIB28228.1 hypothetical protein BFP75_05845 [Maribacter sp. 4G9]
MIVLTSCSGNHKDIDGLKASIQKQSNCSNVELSLSSFGITFSKDSPNSSGARYEFLAGDCPDYDFDTLTAVLLEDFEKKGFCNNAFIIIDFEGGQQLTFSNCNVAKN